MLRQRPARKPDLSEGNGERRMRDVAPLGGLPGAPRRGPALRGLMWRSDPATGRLRRGGQ